MTNTRMLTLLGDAEADAYEFLFSFSSDDDKQEFIKLMQSNELTETEEDLIQPPSADEIRNARPIGMVLSEDVVRQATMIAVTLLAEGNNRLPN